MVVSIDILVLYPAMKLQGVLYLFCMSRIKNESKVYEIDIKIKNHRLMELVSFGIDTDLCKTYCI